MQVVPAASARAMLAGFTALGLDAGALRNAAGIGEAELAVPDGVLPGETFPLGSIETSGRGLSRYQNWRTGGWPVPSTPQRPGERSFSRTSPR